MNFDWNNFPNAVVAIKIDRNRPPLHVVQEWVDASPTGWRDWDWCHFESHAEAIEFTETFPAWVLALDDTPVRREPRVEVCPAGDIDAMIRASQARQNTKKKRKIKL